MKGERPSDIRESPFLIFAAAMAYVPWRAVRGWACLACGECCKWYRVPLTPYEYALIVETLGAGFVEVTGTGNPCLKRVGGTCVFQDASGLCGLQPLGLKPLACKAWPFRVQKRAGDRRALFVYEGEEYYVYVNTKCKGVNAGTFYDLVQAIREVIELRENPRRAQFFSTCHTVGVAPVLLAAEKPATNPRQARLALQPPPRWGPPKLQRPEVSLTYPVAGYADLARRAGEAYPIYLVDAGRARGPSVAYSARALRIVSAARPLRQAVLRSRHVLSFPSPAQNS